jgi:hypothetical protein
MAIGDVGIKGLATKAAAKTAPINAFSAVFQSGIIR